MIVFLDVETVPSQRPDALEAVRATIAPPRTLKKPESVAAWWEREADAAVADAHRKQSLDGGTLGEIISIAACTDTEQEWVHCRAQDESEAALLRAFFDTVEQWEKAEADAAAGNSAYWPSRVWPVAFNAAFDLGFLWRRSIVRQVTWPDWLPAPTARAGRDYGDPMQHWAGWRGHVSLDALCKALSIPSPKGDLDGSEVYDAWLARETERIATYNLGDARAVRELWARLRMRGEG